MAVYMVQAGEDGLIKIGYAENVAGRLVKMRADCPASLSLIGHLDGGRDLESELHKKFKAHKSHGEWFSPHKDILAFAEQNAPSEGSEANNKMQRILRPTNAQSLMEWFQAERGRRIFLARQLGISPSAVTMWKNVPAERVLEIERITGISRHDLRPDLYPREAA